MPVLLAQGCYMYAARKENQGGGAMRRDPLRNDGFHSVTLFAAAPAAMHFSISPSSPAA